MPESPLTAALIDNQAPIGLFDSGIGGLSVYRHVRNCLPYERYLYFADTLHVPYGGRTVEEIRDLTLQAVDWLYTQGCKLIVIACNSASAYGLQVARQRYQYLPIVGLVPALKPAVLGSRTGKVAVLATQATLNGSLLNQVISEVAQPAHTQVVKYFDPMLVPWVESGMCHQDVTAQRLLEQLEQFYDDGVDHLVLGCTHYPFFRDFLLQEIQRRDWQMQVVDSGIAIAARVQYLLTESAMLNHALNRQPLCLYASKCDTGLYEMVTRLLAEPIQMLSADGRLNMVDGWD